MKIRKMLYTEEDKQKNDAYLAAQVSEEFRRIIRSGDGSIHLQDSLDRRQYNFNELKEWSDSSNFSAATLLEKE